jgi:hypothetical protein
MVKAGYTVLEVAVYPDPGKNVVVSLEDFSMTVGSNPDATRAETPAEVAASVEADMRTNQPQIPGRVQVSWGQNDRSRHPSNLDERSMWTPSRPRSPEEVVESVANFARTFEIGEVSAVFEGDQLSIRKCSRDMRSDLDREEVVIAPDN